MMVLPLVTSVALALLGPAGGRGDSQDVAALRDQGLYALALKQAQALDDPTERSREMLEVLYHAGDLAGALGAGLTGLEVAPDDRLLLWRSARLATDLAAASAALDLARRLAREVELLASQPGVEASTSQWWLDTSAVMLEEALQLGELREQQAGARGRARWSALLGLVLLGALATWATQCSGPAQQGGRARV